MKFNFMGGHASLDNISVTQQGTRCNSTEVTIALVGNHTRNKSHQNFTLGMAEALAFKGSTGQDFIVRDSDKKKKFQLSFYNKYQQVDRSSDRDSKVPANQVSLYCTQRLNLASSKEELPKSPTNKPDFKPFSKEQTQLYFLRKKQFQAQHPTASREAQKVTFPILKKQEHGPLENTEPLLARKRKTPGAKQCWLKPDPDGQQSFPATIRVKFQPKKVSRIF
jgi:hypothetical protein